VKRSDRPADQESVRERMTSHWDEDLLTEQDREAIRRQAAVELRQRRLRVVIVVLLSLAAMVLMPWLLRACASG